MTIYVLILNTFMYGSYQKSPAVAQTSTPGFTTQQACINAGKAAQENLITLPAHEQNVVATYLCVPLSI